MRALDLMLVSAVVCLTLPGFAVAQSTGNTTQGTAASPIPYSPLTPVAPINPYNPSFAAPGASPFGMGSPAGTRFGPDPRIGGGAAPTDVNGVPNAPTTRTGYAEQQYQTVPPQPKRKKPKKRKDNSQTSADPELPAADAAAEQEDQPAPAAGDLPLDDPFAR